MILVTGDLHVTDKPSENYRFEFLENTLFEIVRSRLPDVLIILGDLTEEKDHHSARLVNRLVRALDDIAEKTRIIIPAGNHDYKAEGHAFFAFLQSIPKIHWISEPRWGHEIMRSSVGDGWGWDLFLPHTHNHTEDWEGLNFKDAQTIFAHQTFTGAEIGFGRKLTGIDANYFGADASVISGDIHAPQKVGPVEYVGAPYTVDYGDDYKPRMIAIEADGTRTDIDLSKYPQKKTLEIDGARNIAKELEMHRNLNDGDIMRIRVHMDDMAQWSAVNKDIHAWCGENKVRAMRVEPILAKAVINKTAVIDTTKSITDAELLDQFGARHTLSSPVLAMGHKFLEGK